MSAHIVSAILAAFLASMVECVEALTVILAVAVTRGWRAALIGTAGGLVTLFILVAALGPALTYIPLAALQLVVGTLLLLFGLRWLRKAILRAVGIIPLHDEAAIYASETATLTAGSRHARWDAVGIGTAFKIVILEGLEVVFIVVAVGATGGLLLPASLGAAAALFVIIVLGVLLHRPLAQIPENALKFCVGILLAAFGTFWAGEGAGIGWWGGDWAVLALIAGFAAIAVTTVASCRPSSVATARGGE